ncbi:hypothetical protein SVI_1265 [Shewanella violacea DSS12]|uniref:Uncharacterized protein n=1 Tax=Shewanella violacea (strain JCM 10179 / CIP 106290 / LMG 19151 / DSS12) TaxID=637905 RepID=D4ZHT7_SHEVD|nr:hypothetical protein SVI_1265 [Shewanella violacea DSS12]
MISLDIDLNQYVTSQALSFLLPTIASDLKIKKMK